jgi:hypothetical protein
MSIRNAHPLEFWSAWLLVLGAALFLWCYGELGTMEYGFPYAPLAWAGSLPLVFLLVVMIDRRY